MGDCTCVSYRYAARSQEHAHHRQLDDRPNCHCCSWSHLISLRHRQTSYDDAVRTQRRWASLALMKSCLVIMKHCSCFFFLFPQSWHHVQGHNWLLEEDHQGWGTKSLLQRCLVQRDQRHGRCLCVGALWWVQEVYVLNFLISQPQRKPFTLFKSYFSWYSDNSLVNYIVGLYHKTAQVWWVGELQMCIYPI